MDRSLASEEAQRWLGTAEKLLAARDLLGAKSFAIRVREAFPRLESAADDVVAVADTLIAGENRIGGSGTGTHHHQHQQQQGQPDWYAVLSLPRFTQNLEAVANQYRRLALILNPHRNRLPYADEAFRLVTDAWSVLSNPSKKVFYDNELAMYSRFDFGAGNQTQTQTQTQSQSQTHSHHHQHHHHQLQEHQFLQRNNNPQPLHHHQQQPQQQQQHHHFYNQNPSPPPQPPPPQQPQFQPSPPQFQPPRHQPQPPQQPQHQPHHQHHQQQQQQQQTQNMMRKSPRKAVALTIEEERPNLNNAAESSRSVRPAAPSPTPSPSPPPPPPPPPPAAEREQTPPLEPASPDGPTFWTACPFCYILYEYPRLYEDCVLRCQNCKRAFTAGSVPAPPTSDDGTNYFCCWGFFPLGYSGKPGGGGAGSGWTPFSPIFACPIQDEGNKKKGHQGNDKGKRKEPSSPRFIYKDDDVFVEISDESDSSDCDWRNTRKVNNKKSTAAATPTKKNSGGSKGKVKARASGEKRTPKSDRVTRASNGGGERSAAAAAGPAPAVVVAVMAETSRKGKGPGGGGRKRNGAEWGKLDLNVEFNNDVEDSAATAAAATTVAAAAAAAGRGNGVGSGGGEEDNIEGISFFEGLDEFLSSLPILNVVGGDDKVKAS